VRDIIFSECKLEMSSQYDGASWMLRNVRPRKGHGWSLNGTERAGGRCRFRELGCIKQTAG